jgi:hypothetical protein
VAPGRKVASAAASVAKPHAVSQPRRREHREFTAHTTPHSEFVPASTATTPQPAPASAVVNAGSPEPSSAHSEFASEFGG